jgi:hypothetical protein
MKRAAGERMPALMEELVSDFKQKVEPRDGR